MLGNGGATAARPGRSSRRRPRRSPPTSSRSCAGPWHVRARASTTASRSASTRRRSLAPHLRDQAQQMLDVTAAVPRPVPRAVRHPVPVRRSTTRRSCPSSTPGRWRTRACVTFRDEFIFRGAVTDRPGAAARPRPSPTRWPTCGSATWSPCAGGTTCGSTSRSPSTWATGSLAEATRFTDAWTTFAVSRKAWGYARRPAPSTHPVAGVVVDDAAAALLNFDGISYAKGATVLRQLVACLGDEAFLAGVGDYLRSHAFGNGELAEFIASIEASAGRSLSVERCLAADRRGRPDRPGRRRPHPPSAGRPPRRPPAQSRRRRLRRGPGGGRASTSSSRVRSPRCPAWTTCPGAGALVVPNAADTTWAEVCSTRERSRAWSAAWPMCLTRRPARCCGSRCSGPLPVPRSTRAQPSMSLQRPGPARSRLRCSHGWHCS